MESPNYDLVVADELEFLLIDGVTLGQMKTNTVPAQITKSNSPVTVKVEARDTDTVNDDIEGGFCRHCGAR